MKSIIVVIALAVSMLPALAVALVALLAGAPSGMLLGWAVGSFLTAATITGIGAANGVLERDK